MKYEELVTFIKAEVSKATTEKIAELTKRNEYLERKLEVLATEIAILKEGDNI